MRWIAIVAVVSACKGSSNETPVPAPPLAEVKQPGASEPLPPEIAQDVKKVAAKEQATAKAAKGTIAIARAWRYSDPPKIAAGHSWVAVDVDFGGLPIDTDDLEAADADGTAVSAIGDVKRLDASGELTAFSGAHGNETHYLLFFETEAKTKRLSLRYWGETLSSTPVAIADSGPTFARATRVVTRHFASGQRHVLLIEDTNQEDGPDPITNHLLFDGGECTRSAMIPVTRALAPTEPSLEPMIAHAYYLVDHQCAKPPVKLEWGGSARDLPAAERLALPTATLDALAGRGPDVTIIPVADAIMVRVAARRDGTMLAIAPDGGAVRLVDPQGHETARLPGLGKGDLGGLGFTPDGARVWAVEEAGEVFVWDVASGKQLAKRMIDPGPDLYTRPAMTPDGKFLVVDHPWNVPGETQVGWTGQLEVLSLPDLAPKATLKIVKGSAGSITNVKIAPSGKRVIVCGATETETLVNVYGVPGFDVQRKLTIPKSSPLGSCAIDDDGRILLGLESGEVQILDASGKQIAKATGNEGGVFVIEPRANGSFFTGGRDGKVFAWSRAATKPQLVTQHKFAIDEIRTDGDTVITQGVQDVHVVDGTKLVRRLYGSADGPHAIAVAPGLVAVSEMSMATKSARVRIWHRPR